ncbi:MAG: xylulokinase [Rhodospirillales bacterium]
MTGGYLGIDIGTSACKALLMGPAGEVIDSETVGYPLSSPQDGWSEQAPEDWIAGAAKAVQAVLARSRQQPLCIGLSGQMHGMTPLDRDRRVLRPAILWNDQRNAAECAEITEAAGGLEALLAHTGNRMLPGFTGGKIRWLQNHEPAVFERTEVVLNPKDYLRLRLSGEVATEVSDASGTGLFDVARREWSKPLLEKIGLAPSLLPACQESAVVSAKVSAEGASLFGLAVGTPIVGGGGDAVIQTLGSGVVSEGRLQTTIGTAGIAATALARPIANPEGRLQVFCNVAPDLWHCMGVSLNAGGALVWLQRLLSQAGATRDFDELTAAARDVGVGAGGLLFLPYLMGERCPWPDPSARGAFVGLRSHHGSAHLTRALLEGVVFALRDMATLMAEAGLARTRTIHASGGGASSDLWNQIQADIFDAEVATTPSAAEGAAYGAAMLAAVGSGAWRDLAEAAQVCSSDRRWRADPARHAAYSELFDIYRGLYGSLTSANARLAGFDPADFKQTGSAA